MAGGFHWVLTVKAAQRTPGSEVMGTYSGVVEARPGDTRESMFESAREYVSAELERNGHPGGHSVLFFSLEPNQLPTAGGGQ